MKLWNTFKNCARFPTPKHFGWPPVVIKVPTLVLWFFSCRFCFHMESPCPAQQRCILQLLMLWWMYHHKWDAVHPNWVRISSINNTCLFGDKGWWSSICVGTTNFNDPWSIHIAFTETTIFLQERLTRIYSFVICCLLESLLCRWTKHELAQGMNTFTLPGITEFSLLKMHFFEKNPMTLWLLDA